MKVFKDKLKNESGASFIIALVFFLICTLVAAVIIMAASANIERTAQQKEEAQAYLALSSASQLLQSDLNSGLAFKGVTVTTTYSDKKWHKKPVTTVVTTTDIGNASGSALTTYLTTAATAVYTNKLNGKTGTAAAYSTSFTLKMTDMPDVTVAFGMDDSYNVTMVLTTLSDDYPYTMTLDAQTKSAASVVVNTQETGWQWPGNKSEFPAKKGENGGWPGNGNGPYTLETYLVSTATTDVSWNNTTIAKGDTTDA